MSRRIPKPAPRARKRAASTSALSTSHGGDEGRAELQAESQRLREQAQNAVGDAQEHLEVRVKERTAELVELNRKLEEEMAERERAQKEIVAERQRFKDVLDNLPAYLLLLSPDYHVPFANRFFRERFGESKGRRCYEYLFQRTEPCETCETFSVLKTGMPHHWEWTGPDGRNYDIHDYPFKDADGSPLIMEVGLDITERRKAEAELARHRQHLEELVQERTRELEGANAQLQAQIAERKRAEEELRRLNRVLTALSHSNKALMRAQEEAAPVPKLAGGPPGPVGGNP
jgi:PAS domain-containing protein